MNSGPTLSQPLLVVSSECGGRPRARSAICGRIRKHARYIFTLFATFIVSTCTSSKRQDGTDDGRREIQTIPVVPLRCDSLKATSYVAVYEIPVEVALNWLPGLAFRMGKEFSEDLQNAPAFIGSWDRIPATAITQGEAYYIASMMGTTYMALESQTGKLMQGQFRLPTLQESQCYATPVPSMQSLCQDSNIFDNSAAFAFASEVNERAETSLTPEELRLSYIDCNDGYVLVAPIDSGQPDSNGMHHVWGNAAEWLAENSLVLEWSFESGRRVGLPTTVRNSSTDFTPSVGMRVVFEPDGSKKGVSQPAPR